MKSEVKDLIKDMKARGWEVLPGRRKHIKMHHPKFGNVILPRTPSDERWLLNKLSQIKKIEAGIPQRRG